MSAFVVSLCDTACSSVSMWKTNSAAPMRLSHSADRSHGTLSLFCSSHTAVRSSATCATFTTAHAEASAASGRAERGTSIVGWSRCWSAASKAMSFGVSRIGASPRAAMAFRPRCGASQPRLAGPRCVVAVAMYMYVYVYTYIYMYTITVWRLQPAAASARRLSAQTRRRHHRVRHCHDTA